MVVGTFNINKLRLPLLVGVGITNSSKTFPYALSYYLGETAESYRNVSGGTIRGLIGVRHNSAVALTGRPAPILLAFAQ